MKDHSTYEYNRFADIKRLKFIETVLASNLSEGAKVLDVGCGNGIISRYVGTLGYEVLGIDVDEKAIAVAESLNKSEKVSFKIQNAERLISEGAQYDAIICSEVLEHLNYPSKLLEILHVILKPEGLMIVTVPNGSGPREFLVTKPVISLKKNGGIAWKGISYLKKLLGYSGQTIQSASDNLDHIQFFTFKTIEELATANKFKIEVFKKSNFIDDVFPFSLITRKSIFLQKVDSKIAEILPLRLTGGFMTIWKKN